MRVGWAGLGVALALALALVLGAPEDPWARLFGVAAVAGWLLSFLFGVLQRILPFLASMHAAQGQKRPPTPSALTPERPLAVHFAAHLTALALLAAATAAQSVLLTQVAALAGCIGAVAWVFFFAGLMRRLRGAAAPEAAAR
jgi:hypothetical protein